MACRRPASPAPTSFKEAEPQQKHVPATQNVTPKTIPAPTAAAASDEDLGAWDPAWEPRAITASNEDHPGMGSRSRSPYPDPDPVHARFLRQLEMMTREKGLVFNNFLGGRFAHTRTVAKKVKHEGYLQKHSATADRLTSALRWRLAAMMEGISHRRRVMESRYRA